MLTAVYGNLWENKIVTRKQGAGDGILRRARAYGRLR